ncbi:MAG: hypothetical protein J6U54_17835 [Clostridiales bacterium]|nr:hypothetical protein [Clostridiales bacterium]
MKNNRYIIKLASIAVAATTLVSFTACSSKTEETEESVEITEETVLDTVESEETKEAEDAGLDVRVIESPDDPIFDEYELTPDDYQDLLDDAEKAQTPKEDDYYSVATDKSTKEVEKFMEEVVEMVQNNDVDAIVENATFPFYLVGVEYNDADSLKKALEADDSVLMNTDFVKKVLAEDPHDLSANSQGIFLGDGEIWIRSVIDDNSGEQVLKICTFNGV